MRKKTDTLTIRAADDLKQRIEAIRAQYNPHATTTEWVTTWISHMVEQIEHAGADHRTLLPPTPKRRS